MLNTAKKKKMSQNANKNNAGGGIRRSHNATYYSLFPPNVLVSTARALVRQGSMATRGGAHRWRSWEKEREKASVVCVAPPCGSSRSSLVALVPSTDQTAHCTILHWPSVFFSSVHVQYTNTDTHTQFGGAGLQGPREMFIRAHDRGVCTA